MDPQGTIYSATTGNETTNICSDCRSRNRTSEVNNNLNELEKPENMSTLRDAGSKNHPNGSPYSCGHRRHTLTFEEIPQWSQHNPHLLTGYRPISNSVRTCIRSVFCVTNNECLNVMTHFLSAIFYCGLLANWIHEVTVSNPSIPVEEKLTVGIFLAASIACFTLSSIYHTFNSHSERIMNLTVKMDYLGIVLITWGSNYPWIYYAFRCKWYMKTVYYTLIIITGASASLVSTFDYFSKCANAGLRCAVFGAFALSGLIAVTHLLLSLGPSTVWHDLSAKYIFWMFVTYAIGGFLYFTHIPERYWPKIFDIICPSHALFHITVFIGSYIYYQGIMAMYHNRENIMSCGFSN